MTAKTRTIDELIKLSLKVGNAWLSKPTDAGNAITSKAILAVCKHLSHEASYRTDIAALIKTCHSVAERHADFAPSNVFTAPESASSTIRPTSGYE